MDAPKIMKTISPSICPHCSKDIYIDFQTMIPFMAGVIGMDEVKKAKEVIREKIKDIKFLEENGEADVIKWLDDDSILISLNDSEEVLKQILINNTPPKEGDKK